MERTDRLARIKGVPVRDLPEILRMANGTFWNLRSGKMKQPAALRKAWGKLRSAESEAGIDHLSVEETSPERFSPPLPLTPHGRTDFPSAARPPGRVIGPSPDYQLPTPPPTAHDVRAYLDEVLTAAGRDPQRLGWLLDELKMRLEERRQWWLRLAAQPSDPTAP